MAPSAPVSPMSVLSLDLHIAILGHLPPARCQLSDNVAIQTLINYSQVNSLLREAASVPGVWGPHYRTRYRHCITNNENLRNARYGGNWRLMYYERYRIDAVALELLREVTISRGTRNQKALILSRMGLDIRDALDILVASTPAIQALSSVEPPYSLTLCFWAKKLLENIARGEAIHVWATLMPTDENGSMKKRASFEQTMLGLSLFFGESMQNLTRIFDEMEAKCRLFVQKETTLDVESPKYYIPEICQSIIAFMISNEFGPPRTNTVFDMLNHFPHAYLTTNKRTIPIALAHVFVTLARRLGLDASPVNFPEKVLCHVQPFREGERPYYVNVFVADAQNCMIKAEDLGLHLSDTRLLESIADTYKQQYLHPADSSAMLLRASRNILVSYSHATNLSYGITQGCLYLAMVVHLMFHDRDIGGAAQIMRMVDLCPVDCATFLMDKLAPLLPYTSRLLLTSHCEQALEEDASEAEMVQIRGSSQRVKFCVGLPFRHRRYGYVACIIRWDSVCKASETWINQMRVDDLDRGRHQPFYTSLVLDEHATQRYIAEENIQPAGQPEALIKEFFEKHPIMAMYFQGVEFEDSMEPVRRWRMTLSPESNSSYPEDDAMGSAWVRDGVLPG